MPGDIVIGAAGYGVVPPPSGDSSRLPADPSADFAGKNATAAADEGVLRQRLFAVPLRYMPSYDVGQTVSFLLFDGEAAHGRVGFSPSLRLTTH